MINFVAGVIFGGAFTLIMIALLSANHYDE
jgi:hypothetical protein